MRRTVRHKRLIKRPKKQARPKRLLSTYKGSPIVQETASTNRVVNVRTTLILEIFFIMIRLKINIMDKSIKDIIYPSKEKLQIGKDISR